MVRLSLIALCGLLIAACARESPLPLGLNDDIQPQTPMAADAFVDSIGVNTHLTEDLTADREYAVITQRMKQSGIRHIRDGIFPEESLRQYADQRDFFEATGARMDAITDCPQPLGYYPGSYTPPTVVRTYDRKIAGAIDALEGPNEPDLRHVGDWPTLTISCMKKRHLTRALPLPFIAPAMGDAVHGNPAKLGSIAALVDFGAIHRYFSPGWNPGWPGYGHDACGSIESLRWAICEARVNSGPTLPIDVTETGYTTSGEYGYNPFEVDEVTDGKYVSRVLLVDSIAGIARTYIYEFHDDGHDKIPWENGFGIVRYDGSPKPAFNAVRSEIHLLSDPGPAFSPAPLRYSLKTAIETIEHELFQKRDGTYVLAIWNETESWDPTTGKEVTVPSSQVRLELELSPVKVRFRALDDDGTLYNRAASVVGSTILVRVDDHVAFLSFRVKSLSR